MSHSSQSHGLWPTRPLCPWDFPGKKTGVDCHFLLQGIFPTQELNPHLLHQVNSQQGSLPTYEVGTIVKYNLHTRKVRHRQVMSPPQDQQPGSGGVLDLNRAQAFRDHTPQNKCQLYITVGGDKFSRKENTGKQDRKC